MHSESIVQEYFTFIGPRQYLVVDNAVVNYIDVKKLLLLKEYNAQPQAKDI